MFNGLFQIFLTPLSIEVVQRLIERAGMMLTAIHPASVIQHIYASCALRCHKQPITAESKTVKQGTTLPEVNAHIGVPPVYITLFQCAVVENTVPKGTKDDLFTSANVDCTVNTIAGKECSFNVFAARNPNVGFL
ncbi:unnamed protein product [Gongylonema pulchrum]|uniref:DUF1907 domain-containing protein n=1 Tax=Gongylonema pulchrum TaxID=637853 RepID=A0A183DL90_9BILA|nr:unnamed protein product [Gongylonema pulchrum]